MYSELTASILPWNRYKRYELYFMKFPTLRKSILHVCMKHAIEQYIAFRTKLRKFSEERKKGTGVA
jgi:hypothetical protein